MTTTKELATTENTAPIADLPDGYEWETVHTEQPDRIVFEEVDDYLIGTYIGSVVITPEPTAKVPDPDSFTQLLWRDCIVNGERMEYVSTNAGYVLLEAFSQISPNTLTRVTLKGLRDVDQASPMKDYRVECATRKP
jgi:hypothetical protein